MARTKNPVVVTLDTIWEMPDEAWERLERILADRYPPADTGRPRTNLRKAFDGIIFRLRTGCQWNHLPKTFGDDSTVHRWFQQWVKDEVFEQLWAELLQACDELGGVEWKWQAADGCLGKARFGGKKRAETPPTEESRAPRKVLSLRAMEARSA